MQYTTNKIFEATVLLFFITTLFFIFGFSYVSAQEGYVPLSPLPGINMELFSGSSTAETTASYLQNMFLLIIGIAAVLAVIMIAFGGLQYVMSAAFQTKEDGKKRIWAAIGGLILAFSAWLILNTINPELLNLSFNKIQEGAPIGSGSTPNIVVGPAINETYYICYENSSGVSMRPSGTSESVCNIERSTILTNPTNTGASRCFRTPNIRNPSIAMCPLIESAPKPTNKPTCILGTTNACFPFDGLYWYCVGSGSDNSRGPFNVITECNSILPDNAFDYDTGISPQLTHASGALRSLLVCMASKVPNSVGRISSISDSKIVSGDKTMNECRAGGQSIGCAHKRSSCHYGGTAVPGCQGESFAVDFGDQENANILIQATQTCNADYIKNEGDHIHVSVGQSNGCGCQ